MSVMKQSMKWYIKIQCKSLHHLLIFVSITLNIHKQWRINFSKIITDKILLKKLQKYCKASIFKKMRLNMTNKYIKKHSYKNQIMSIVTKIVKTQNTD